MIAECNQQRAYHPHQNPADGLPIAGIEAAGIALAYSRLIPPLDRLMLGHYDASIRTAAASITLLGIALLGLGATRRCHRAKLSLSPRLRRAACLKSEHYGIRRKAKEYAADCLVMGRRPWACCEAVRISRKRPSNGRLSKIAVEPAL